MSKIIYCLDIFIKNFFNFFNIYIIGGTNIYLYTFSGKRTESVRRKKEPKRKQGSREELNSQNLRDENSRK